MAAQLTPPVKTMLPGGVLPEPVAVALANALDRTARAEIAAFALVVDAKNQPAAAFYRHHGFIALPSAQLTLFLPLATVRFSRYSLGWPA